MESIKSVARKRRHSRIRKKIQGTAQRPRLCIFKSNKNIYAQIIDDVKGVTLASASTIDNELKNQVDSGGSNIKNAQLIGKAVAERAIKQGIDKVVFDRGGNIYHGKIKALSDAARGSGLKF